MKLRYYLRGLGMGVVVTAIIMSLTRESEKLTDSQIKLRAKELGMVEEILLSDIQEKNDTLWEQDTAKKEESAAAEEKTDVTTVKEEISEESAVSKEASAEEEEKLQEEPSEEKNTLKAEPSENMEYQPAAEEVVENYVVITVAAGNGSEEVSNKLYEAGLISSAAEYNQYLMENGYDRKLRAGSHEIPVGATNEEIAKILVKK